MKVDITQLLIFFDEIMVGTDENQGIYKFRGVRSDGLIISFRIMMYEDKVSIALYNASDHLLAGLYLNSCKEINVLDEKQKCLEVLHENGKGRCFLTLLGDAILEYSDEDTPSRQN